MEVLIETDKDKEIVELSLVRKFLHKSLKNSQ